MRNWNIRTWKTPAFLSNFPLLRTDFDESAHLLVWTTTPWTLPANLAVAVHPDVMYVPVEYDVRAQHRVAIVASDLVEKVFARIARTRRSTELAVEGIGTCRPRILPSVHRPHGKIVTADYVTTTDGTGLVHTAPGHGEDDYETGMRYGLNVYSPVLANGRFDDTVPEFIRGKTTKEANPLIIEELADRGLLFAEQKIIHSYPHDWRSKTPIIFRATEQWFIAMNQSFGQGKPRFANGRSKRVPEAVDFVPEWGRHRIAGMLQSRPDWCISRQRAGDCRSRSSITKRASPADAGIRPRRREAICRKGIGCVVHRFAGRVARIGFPLSRRIFGREPAERKRHLRCLVRKRQLLACGAAGPAGAEVPR